MWAAGAGAQDVPPPAERATLFLDLVVNGAPRDSAVRVEYRAGRLYVGTDDLRRAGIDPARLQLAADQQWVDLRAVPALAAVYDANALQLRLTVPPEWLPTQQLGRVAGGPVAPARVSFGALLGYDLYLARQRQQAEGADPMQTRITALWSEQRVFGARGLFSNTGVYRHLSGDVPGVAGVGLRNGYTRYDTQWSGIDEQRLISWNLGDVISAVPGWGAAVRLGGLRIARDFRLRPDLITYPLPQFAGQAALPSTVDLFVNGARAGSEQIQPGPFSIASVPFINGAGEATVVTTDALGRQTAVTMPFYVSHDLLKAGLTDYAVSVGALRRGYGIDDFSYGAVAATGAVRHGISDSLTLEAQVEGAGELMLAGAGAVGRLGQLGVFNASLTHSRLRDVAGTQATFGYRYSARGLSVGYQGVRRSAGYGSLAQLELDRRWPLIRRSDVLTFGVSFDRYGALGGGYFDLRDGDGMRSRLLNLSYSLALWRQANLQLTLSRDLERRRHAVMAYLWLPFDDVGVFSAAMLRDADGRHSERIGYSRNPPVAGGLGWNLALARGGQDGDYRQGGLAWASRHARLDVGSYGTRRARTDWAGLRGSVVAMDGSLFTAGQIHDSFALVSTDGVAGVPVRYENQQIGVTDSNGHLLVPWVSSHYQARYEIDPLGLPTNLSTPEVEQRLAVRRGGGAVLRFAVQRITPGVVMLIDAAGHPLPVGSRAVDEHSGHEAWVGHDGLAYFESLRRENRLRVTRPDGQTCSASFAFDTAGEQLSQIGPLPCQ
ncbi:MAG: fimbria/pilus outer membrane usher protein [Burkholderiaceae bacterium]